MAMLFTTFVSYYLFAFDISYAFIFGTVYVNSLIILWTSRSFFCWHLNYLFLTGSYVFSCFQRGDSLCICTLASKNKHLTSLLYDDLYTCILKLGLIRSVIEQFWFPVFASTLFVKLQWQVYSSVGIWFEKLHL